MPPKLRTALIRAGIIAALVLVLVLVLAEMPYRWNWRTVWLRRGALLDGLSMTFALSLGGLVGGLVFGALGCLARLSRFEAIRFSGVCYVELVRNTPLLVQLYVAYYGFFPAFGYTEPFTIGCLCLGVFAGAYVAEILRAGVESIDRGQVEASLSLGLTRGQTLAYVVLPQAIRRVIPPLAGQFVSLVKDSSLLSTISIGELLFEAQKTAQQDLAFFELYLTIAVLYLAVTFPLSGLSSWLERRFAAGRRG